MGARALLDGRYRLDALVRRSPATTIHVATHRNGSTAWLKLPLSAAHADLIALEARIANTIGSPLIVRDDGTTPDGVPYLVLDPPEAESVAALRTRGRAGTRLPLARVMTAGDALARVVASIHAMGYVTAGLEDEDVLVFANGDVALLDLHALVPATAVGMAGDVMHVRNVLSALVADVADTAAAGPARTVIDGALAAAYPDVAALQAAWRAASPEPIGMPMRIRSGSLADIPSSPAFPAHDTPFSVSVGSIGRAVSAATAANAGSAASGTSGSGGAQRDPDGSMIGYLRSGGVPSVRPPVVAPRDRAQMYDPLSKLAEMPRLVQATSHAATPEARSSKSRLLVGLAIAAPLLAVLSGGTYFTLRAPRHAPAAAALQAPADPVAPLAPLASAPVAKASPPAPMMVAPPEPAAPAAPEPAAPATPSADDLELTSTLRSENAPPGRDVFLDGKVVGQTPLHVSVPCGRHALQMVAGAPKQNVELPCGGERVVKYDAKGHWSLK